MLARNPPILRSKPIARRASLSVVATLAVGTLLIPGTAQAAPPPNDDLANRQVSSFPFSHSVDTEEATGQAGELPSSCGMSLAHTVWYEYTPAQIMEVQIDTLDTTIDTVLAVYTSSNINPTFATLQEVTCNNDHGPDDELPSSKVEFAANPGTTYFIQVGGWTSTDYGSFTVNVRAPTYGSIDGTVRGQAPAGLLENICVEVNASDGSVVAFEQTDISGVYRVDDLLPGTYKVFFHDGCDGSREYLPQWFDAKASEATADPITVQSGVETSAIDATLPLGSRIEGTVTAEGSGAPLDDICVNAFDEAGDFPGFGETDASGAYEITGLPSGLYQVLFTDCSATRQYLQEWYDDAPNEASSDLVTVTAPGTVQVDAALALGGSISGQVSDGAGPVQDICVEVVTPGGAFGGSTETDALGNYWVGALPSGEYIVKFYDGCDGNVNLAYQWYAKASTLAEADPVPVEVPNETSGIDVVLEEGGGISGDVTGPGGGPLSLICVDLYEATTGEEVWRGNTGTSGAGYEFPGLPSGEYLVKFWSCDVDGMGWAAEWYDDQAGRSLAEVVRVTSPNTTPGIDAELLQGGGEVSGTVSAVGAGPLERACVDVVLAPTGDVEREVVTLADGTYHVPGLYPAEYKLRFSDECDAGVGYASEWYDDQPTQAAADVLGLADGSPVTGVDAVLAPPTGPGPGPGPGPGLGPGGSPGSPGGIQAGQQSKSITLAARPKKVDPGKKTSLQATMAPCTPSIQGDMVQFTRGKKTVASVVADQACTALLKVKMQKTGRFKATSPADVNSQGATSNKVKVKVTS